MKTGQTDPGYWLQRARNIQNRIWLLLNTLWACQTHVCCSLRWFISSFCSFPTKVNSMCISAKCQHVFVKPTSCSDNLNFPYELLLDECDIPPRVAGNAENRWPLIRLMPSQCALMVLMIIVAADTDVSLSRTAARVTEDGATGSAWYRVTTTMMWSPTRSELIQFSQKKLLLMGSFIRLNEII